MLSAMLLSQSAWYKLEFEDVGGSWEMMEEIQAGMDEVIMPLCMKNLFKIFKYLVN